MAYKLGKSLSSGKEGFYKNNINIGGAPKSVLKNENDIEYVVVEEKDGEEEKDGVEEICEEDNSKTDKDYVSVIKKVKKENITPDNIGEIMLCQIPGISSVTAIAIMDKFKTISNLLKEVENNENTLKDITYTNSKGQTRKINKTCTANIVKYLLKK
jgi:ERCC4-type nuclease